MFSWYVSRFPDPVSPLDVVLRLLTGCMNPASELRFRTSSCSSCVCEFHAGVSLFHSLAASLAVDSSRGRREREQSTE